MAIVDRERWQELEPLLDHALTLPPDACAEWLAALGQQQPRLAAELRSLLSEDSRAAERGFLGQPPAMSLAGMQVGAYTLDRPLGHGGMGSVWLAHRADGRFEGRVAVKFMNLALLTPVGQERFRREGTTLARVAHPGIARLLDAGVAPAGQPYLVIEYIDGERIDVFANTRNLSTEARIGLLLQVLAAVGHAHANLVVHRDIKPSNILVSGDGTAKLLDFGIAKLLASGNGSELMPLTGDGRALTPDYAAPEQLSGEPVTTATDVYALGILLYLLLSGRHPTASGSPSPAEAVHALLEVEPAPLGMGDDMDTIVAKALRKDPRQRYQTVGAFADDLQRYLRHEPVSARPDSLAYRARKFARRNRWPLAAGASIVMLLGAYVWTVAVQSSRVRSALAEARLGTHRAEQVTDYMLGLFKVSEGGRLLADTAKSREVLDLGVAQARAFAGQPELTAQLLDVIGRIETYLGRLDRATPLLQEALATRSAIHGEYHADVATSLESLADASGDAASQVELRQKALALRHRLASDDDRKTVDALFELANALHRAGDVKAARPLFDEWMRAISGRPRDVTAARAQQLITVANLMQFSGEPGRAERMLREALAINRALYGERHDEVASTLASLAVLVDNTRRLDGTRRSDEAEPLAREAVAIHRVTFPQGHPALASSLRVLGVVLEHLRRFEDAQPPLREALSIRRRYFGDDAVLVAISELDLAYALIMSGTYDEAVGLARDASRVLRRQFGDDNSMVAFAKAHLGDALRGQGKLAEAESHLLAAYAKLEVPKPATSQWRGYLLGALIRLEEAKGRPDVAAKYRALVDAPAR